MTRRLSRFAFVVLVAFVAPSYAAGPEFEVWLVTESRTYEREQLFSTSPSVGMPVIPVRVPIHRVTVLLEGARVTGEWDLQTSQALAREFPLGANVEAATRRNRLLLKRPDGGVVNARIVRHEKPEQDESD